MGYSAIDGAPTLLPCHATLGEHVYEHMGGGIHCCACFFIQLLTNFIYFCLSVQSIPNFPTVPNLPRSYRTYVRQDSSNTGRGRYVGPGWWRTTYVWPD